MVTAARAGLDCVMVGEVSRIDLQMVETCV